MRLQTDFPKSYFDFPQDEADSFDYHRNYPPEYSYWKNASLWTVDESVHLVYGVTPNFYELRSEKTSGVDSKDNAERELRKAYKLLERDILAGNIRTKGRTRSKVKHLFPNDVVNWAFSKGIEVPQELLSFLKNNKQDINKSFNAAQKPPYLDTEHDYYAEELAIAVETWMVLFEDEQYISKKETFKNPQFKKDIQKHIKDHYKIDSARKIDRITTVINPRKRGGAQSTN